MGDTGIADSREEGLEEFSHLRKGLPTVVRAEVDVFDRIFHFVGVEADAHRLANADDQPADIGTGEGPRIGNHGKRLLSREDGRILLRDPEVAPHRGHRQPDTERHREQVGPGTGGIDHHGGFDAAAVVQHHAGNSPVFVRNLADRRAAPQFDTQATGRPGIPVAQQRRIDKGIGRHMDCTGNRCRFDPGKQLLEPFTTDAFDRNAEPFGGSGQGIHSLFGRLAGRDGHTADALHLERLAQQRLDLGNTVVGLLHHPHHGRFGAGTGQQTRRPAGGLRSDVLTLEQHDASGSPLGQLISCGRAEQAAAYDDNIGFHL